MVQWFAQAYKGAKYDSQASNPSYHLLAQLEAINRLLPTT